MIYAVVKISLIIIMGVWIKKDYRIYDKNIKKLSDDDFYLTWLENMCKICNNHLSFGIILGCGVCIGIIFSIKVDVFWYAFLVVAMICPQMFRRHIMEWLMLDAVIFDRSRDYNFVYVEEFQLQQGKSDFFDKEGKIFAKEDCVDVYIQKMRYLTPTLYVEFWLCYLLVVSF